MPSSTRNPRSPVCPRCGGPKRPESRHCLSCYKDRPAERFWEKVEKAGLDECWAWTGAISSNGYGRFNVSATDHRTAHRYAYELLVGPISDGMEVDHICHNGSGCPGGKSCPHRRCVNPRHLEAVTHRENGNRGNSVPGRNARKMHCLKGHPLSGANVFLRSNGRRECLTCRDERSKARSQKAAA